jgi:hypothetical protein
MGVDWAEASEGLQSIRRIDPDGGRKSGVYTRTARINQIFYTAPIFADARYISDRNPHNRQGLACCAGRVDGNFTSGDLATGLGSISGQFHETGLSMVKQTFQRIFCS